MVYLTAPSFPAEKDIPAGSVATVNGVAITRRIDKMVGSFVEDLKTKAEIKRLL
jgi:hypothetical protein